MPPKKSKKNVEKEKKKAVEDRTFGLKNKNKSKKVQKYVETVKKQVNHKYEGGRKGGSSSGAGNSAQAAAKRAMMERRLAELNMMNQPVKEKAKKLSPEEEALRKKEAEEEAERIRIANLPVEDQIEEERAKLTTRTPVTEELFMEWKKEKDEERAAVKAARHAAALKQMSKSERARGQGLTGRQLFEAHQNLFVDDEDADSSTLRPRNDYIGDSEDETDATTNGIAGLDVQDADEGEVAVGDVSLFS